MGECPTVTLYLLTKIECFDYCMIAYLKFVSTGVGRYHSTSTSLELVHTYDYVSVL